MRVGQHNVFNSHISFIEASKMWIKRRQKEGEEDKV
jgi:hypothetical protein